MPLSCTPTRAPAGKRLSQLIATVCGDEEIPEVSLDIERGAVQHALALVAARLNQSIMAWLLSFCLISLKCHDYHPAPEGLGSRRIISITARVREVECQRQSR